MKVIFDYQTFTIQKYGGISKYFVSLAKELILSKVDLKIVSPFYINKYINEIDKEYVYGKGPLKVPDKATKLLLNINSFLYNQKIDLLKPDLVHKTYYYDSNYKKPYVITVYDMIHEIYYSDSKNKAGLRIIEQKKKSILKADQIICISDSTKKDLLKFIPVNEEKIKVIHLGVDQIKLDHTVYEDKSDKPFLLYVGKRDGYKNFKLLIEAYSASSKLLKDFTIIAFGGGKFTNYENLLFQKLNINNKKIINIQGNDLILNHLYKTAHAFIYPSIYEGFGIPPLEAMSQNCPVIVSNSSSIPEVVGNAGVYFDPKSVESLLSAIESIVYSDSKIKSFVNLGRERIKEFSWAECAKKTIDTYNILK